MSTVQPECVIACSGFPIAVSRYLAEFMAVEVADTELGIPGMGTLRRWQRESPDDFVFTVLAPSCIGESGFAETREAQKAFADIRLFATRLGARAVVFRVPPQVALTRPLAQRVKRMLAGESGAGPQAILDAPHWKPEALSKLCESAGAIAAQDPLVAGAPPSGSLAYLTLPGPAGHRSRYDDEALETIAKLCRASTAAETIVVFRNIDMESNAKTLTELLRG